jgi:4a-hydroxytetrahydrobiopterin dehydratase
MTLAHEHCKDGTPALAANAANDLAKEIPNWEQHAKSITRDRTFTTFTAAIGFVNAVAALANAENHHPDIDIRFNRVRLELSTHDAGGVTRNDFILAAKIDLLA